jgi:hypothetical protein
VTFSGWIRLHRKLLDSAVFTSRSPADLKVFVACLLLANNQPRAWFNGQCEEEIARGTFVTSQFRLAEVTRLSRKEVRGALERLQRHGSIWAKPRAKHSTLITVVNFDTYQCDLESVGQAEGHQRAKTGPTKGHNVRRREVRKNSLSLTEQGFDRFWQAYPRKVAKQDALRAWTRLASENGLVETILAAVARHKASPDWQRNDGRYIPYPASWLNGRRWEDELSAEEADPDPYAGLPVYSDDDFDRDGNLTPEAKAREAAHRSRENNGTHRIAAVPECTAAPNGAGWLAQ